jgi:hypothetical protein
MIANPNQQGASLNTCESKNYHYELEQNMRDDTLMHIKSAGIRIEEWKAPER